MSQARLRLKSVRPGYRRGGLELSSASWLELSAEAAREVGEAGFARLLDDPVVLIEATEDEGATWRKFDGEEREEVARLLAQQLVEIPATKPDPATDAIGGGSVPAAGAGGVPTAPAAPVDTAEQNSQGEPGDPASAASAGPAASTTDAAAVMDAPASGASGDAATPAAVQEPAGSEPPPVVAKPKPARAKPAAKRKPKAGS